MDYYKSLDKYYKNHKEQKNKKSFGKYIKSFISRVLICLCLFLIALIISKKNVNLSNKIYKQVYEQNLSFAKINAWYQKYFGSILPVDKIVPDEVPVFGETLTYSKANLYKNGVCLEVGKEYLVPVLESGIIIFIGEKEDYGHTVIIQQTNGVDVWYGNIKEDVTLYDYVEKGELLGEVQEGKLYLLFQQDGKFLDYQKYLA